MTEQIKNGGPAFPTESAHQASGSTWHYEGMTLLDYFATKCDVGAYNPADAFFLNHNRKPTISELADYIAEIRYIEARAMLKAREAA